MAAHPSRKPWTKEQAHAAAQKSAESRRLRKATRESILAPSGFLKRALSSEQALGYCLEQAYRTMSGLVACSAQAERCSRVLLTLEHIRRIQGKAPRPGTAGSPGSSAVAQSGPIGEAPPITPPSTEIAREPIPDPETSDEPPQMSDEV